VADGISIRRFCLSGFVHAQQHLLLFQIPIAPAIFAGTDLHMQLDLHGDLQPMPMPTTPVSPGLA
jgi:hypothetical protein